MKSDYKTPNTWRTWTWKIIFLPKFSFSFCSASHVLGHTDRVFMRHSQGCQEASHAERLIRSFGELQENNADMDTVTPIFPGFLESSLLCYLIHFVLLLTSWHEEKCFSRWKPALLYWQNGETYTVKVAFCMQIGWYFLVLDYKKVVFTLSLSPDLFGNSKAKTRDYIIFFTILTGDSWHTTRA